MTSRPGSDLLPVAAYALPGAREVVGRGLQLAYDASAEIRRASLYVGLLLFAVAGPALVVLIADIPRLRDFPFGDPAALDPERARAFISVFGSLSILATIALLGFVTISIDGAIMAVTILGARAVGRPVTLRQALMRARQVFWRYGAVMLVVGIIGQVASTAMSALTVAVRNEATTGADLLSVFASTIVTAPLGYVAAGIILGDVDAGTALRRSITLARARPRLAVVVAVFAFLAGVLELFGIGAAADAVGRVIAFEHLSFDPSRGDALVALPVIAAALIALGSLGLTVAAVVAAPQVVAFLGLTHYSAGLDRVGRPTPSLAVSVSEPAEGGGVGAADIEAAIESGHRTSNSGLTDPANEPEAPTSEWLRGAEPHHQTFRWVTIPMLLLIAFALFIAIAGLVAVS